ncbi:helix-turn-helix transcriptional regulator [Tsukamurella sp. USMM236]|uniref:helix-turn-helix transcriptional regulator n=1 Tax=Tsukamurella sp. USMM236 TaxID=3081301 RepID=UPI003017609E
MEDIDPIIRIKEVAALTGAAEGTHRYWDSIGTGPKSFKLNGRRVWRRSSVLAWIEQQEAATTHGGAA